jgi:hypothetical protein
MFRVIGGAVVYGLALYGAVRLFDRPRLEVVIQPGGKPGDGKRSGTATDIDADTSGTPTPDRASEASTPSTAVGET